MKQFFLSVIAVVLTLGLGMAEAEAKRLGGSSFGMQRQTTPPPAPRQPAAAPQQAPQQGATAGAQPRRSWMGPLAGLAAGLGLAALFSHLGLGEEMASFVMILLLALVAVAVFRMLTRRSPPTEARSGAQYAGAGAGTGDASSRDTDLVAFRSAGPAAPPAGSHSLPADFDAAGFARQAKVQFIRLQAANDAGNLEDIRQFTTPEVFAEIRMQLAERGTTPQRTDVVELNAEVVEVAEEPQRYVVSVRFFGLLREEADAAPAPFDEIWHLTKPVSGGGGWVVAGIQQMA